MGFCPKNPKTNFSWAKWWVFASPEVNKVDLWASKWLECDLSCARLLKSMALGTSHDGFHYSDL
jgi:hypothetical protein